MTEQNGYIRAISIYQNDQILSEQVIIGKRHTVVIPKSIRSKVGITEGQKVLIRVEKGRVVMEPLPEDPYRVIGEIVGRPYDENVDEKKAEKWLRKYARR